MELLQTQRCDLSSVLPSSAQRSSIRPFVLYIPFKPSNQASATMHTSTHPSINSVHDAFVHLSYLCQPRTCPLVYVTIHTCIQPSVSSAKQASVLSATYSSIPSPNHPRLLPPSLLLCLRPLSHPPSLPCGSRVIELKHVYVPTLFAERVLGPDGLGTMQRKQQARCWSSCHASGGLAS